jgi:hypothetical protein
MLEIPFFDDGKGLAGVRVEEEHQAAEQNGLHAILVLYSGVSVVPPANDVRLHPNGMAM